MTKELPRLSRALVEAPPAAPIRLVHIGLGNFHRAHQAWFTAHAPDAAEWGYASFTGTSPRAADALRPQDGMYTLIVRGSTGDSFETVSALSAAHAAGEHEAYLGYLARPEVAVVTITVTEAGYLRRPDGHLDLDDPTLSEDVALLRRDPGQRVRSLPARLLAGLLKRRSAGGAAAGDLTILSCDNLPNVGVATKTVVYDLASLVDESLIGWMDEHVEFASSMVDRITPNTTDADRSLVADECGYLDASPVPTEPFHEWVVAGRFAAGRPRWEEAGVTMVGEVEPFEQRKLLLLNGSHSLLAYAASIRGHETIDQAIGDSACRSWVAQFWDEASRQLSLPEEEIAKYRQALLVRFSNSRLRDHLARIAADGSQKLLVRTVPVVKAERLAGRLPRGSATTLAAWILHLRGLGAPLKDQGAGLAREAANTTDLQEAVPAVLETLQPGLGGDAELVALVLEQTQAIVS